MITGQNGRYLPQMTHDHERTHFGRNVQVGRPALRHFALIRQIARRIVLTWGCNGR